MATDKLDVDKLALFLRAVKHIVENTRGAVVNMRPVRFAAVIYALYGVEANGFMSLYYRLAAILRPCLVVDYYETVYKIAGGRVIRKRRERAFTYWLSCVKEELRAVEACPYILYAVRTTDREYKRRHAPYFNNDVTHFNNDVKMISVSVDSYVVDKLQELMPHLSMSEIVRIAIEELIEKWAPITAGKV